MVSVKSYQNRNKMLEKYLDKKVKFRGTVGALNRSKKNRNSTVILVNEIYLVDENKRLADHLWVESGSIPKELSRGDKIEFTATVYKYKRDYNGNRNKLPGYSYGAHGAHNIIVTESWFS